MNPPPPTTLARPKTSESARSERRPSRLAASPQEALLAVGPTRSQKLSWRATVAGKIAAIFLSSSLFIHFSWLRGTEGGYCGVGVGGAETRTIRFSEPLPPPPYPIEFGRSNRTEQHCQACGCWTTEIDNREPQKEIDILAGNFKIFHRIDLNFPQVFRKCPSTFSVINKISAKFSGKLELPTCKWFFSILPHISGVFPESLLYFSKKNLPNFFLQLCKIYSYIYFNYEILRKFREHVAKF